MFVGNHRSYFDILSCHNAIGFPVGFMSKEEIKKIPLLHLYMDDIGCTYLVNEAILRRALRSLVKPQKSSKTVIP